MFLEHTHKSSEVINFFIYYKASRIYLNCTTRGELDITGKGRLLDFALNCVQKNPLYLACHPIVSVRVRNRRKPKTPHRKVPNGCSANLSELYFSAQVLRLCPLLTLIDDRFRISDYIIHISGNMIKIMFENIFKVRFFRVRFGLKPSGYQRVKR